jgi:cytochrome c biogenesis protein CcmG/thiol:disulfide interchange protein DsbE
MSKARRGRLLLGGLILLGLLLLGLSSGGCSGAFSPAQAEPTEDINPTATRVSPPTYTPTHTPTPTIQATPVVSSPTGTPILANPTPTPPPVTPREGFTAPDFSLLDLQGRELTLGQFRGRPVMVNFWTTWCPYCREEMATLEAASHRYVEQGLVILAVNVQESTETLAPFAQSEGLTFPILLDSYATVTGTYLTRVIPTTFFIDRRGVINVIHLGPLTDEIIDSYLTELLSGG